MFSKLKNKIYFLLPVIFVLIFLGYSQFTSKSEVKAEKSYRVKLQNLQDSLSIAGQIEAEERAVLKFQTSGMLSWVGVKKGDYVKKYQGIAALDRSELEKDLKQDLNTYASEHWDFDKTKTDNKDKGLADAAIRRLLDQAQSDLDNAVLDVEIKNIALQYSYLYTPIEGIVIRVDAPYSGVNITPTTAEFEVVNPNTVYFSANADQTEVTSLREKMKGEVGLDAYSDLKIPAEIYLISFTPKKGETSTVYEIKLRLKETNENYKYKLGMTGDVTFALTENKKVLVIPSTFIKSDKDKKYVLRFENGRKIKTYIETGKEVDNEVEITSGLNEGDIIYD